MSDNDQPEAKMDPLGQMFLQMMKGFERDFSIARMLSQRQPWTDRRAVFPLIPPATPYEQDSFNTASEIMRSTAVTTYTYSFRVPRPVAMTEDDEQALRRAISEGMTRQTDNAPIHPLLPDANLRVSNLPSPPTQMNADILKEMMANMPKDPLLARGVARDWICVVNHRTHAALEEHARQQPPIMLGMSMTVEMFTRRRTEIVPVAEDGLSYMPEIEMYRRYREYFVARAQAALARIRREKLRAVRRAYGRQYAADEKARRDAENNTDG